MKGWRDFVVSQVPDSAHAWEVDYEHPFVSGDVGAYRFGALMLRLSCHIVGVDVPATIPRGWKFTEDPVVNKAMSEGGSVPSFILAEIWIPDPRIGFLRCTGPNGNTIGVATTATFRQDLDALNSAIWQTSSEEILSWSETMPEESDAMDTETLARYAFSVMWRVLAPAESERMPVAVWH